MVQNLDRLKYIKPMDIVKNDIIYLIGYNDNLVEYKVLQNPKLDNIVCTVLCEHTKTGLEEELKFNVTYDNQILRDYIGSNWIAM